MDDAADAVDTAVHCLGPKDHGYANTVIHPRRSVVTVYWKGSVPRQVRDYVARQVPGVAVLYRTAAFSQDQLSQAQVFLLNSPAANRDRVVGIDQAANGDGLVAYVNENRTGHSRTHDLRTLRRAGGTVPVIAVHSSGPVEPT